VAGQKSAVIERGFDRDLTQAAEFNRHMNHKAYILVSDPLPVEDGGYSPGAKFEGLDLFMFPNSFTPGTILRDKRSGAMYKIYRRKNGRNKALRL